MQARVIAAVSHADVIKAALAYALGLPLHFYDRFEVVAGVGQRCGRWRLGTQGSERQRDDAMTKWTPEAIRERAAALGEWFHNLDLKGVRTAPNHFLYDYPSNKFSAFAHALPADLSGKSVLDIGCNGGFYSLEMKRRGAARVLGIDSDDRYLAQARFAAEVSERDIEFRNLSVYDVARLGERFDVVLFMGVFYHLRHPLLALDLLHEHVVARSSGVPVHAAGRRARSTRWRRTTTSSRSIISTAPAIRSCISSSTPTRTIPPTGGRPTPRRRRRCCAPPASRSKRTRSAEVYLCRRVARPGDAGAVYPARGA